MKVWIDSVYIILKSRSEVWIILVKLRITPIKVWIDSVKSFLKPRL